MGKNESRISKIYSLIRSKHLATALNEINKVKSNDILLYNRLGLEHTKSIILTKLKNNNKYNTIVYTVCTGNQDELSSLKNASQNVAYIAFVDKYFADVDGWEQIVIENENMLNPRDLSRLPKMLPHVYLPPHTYSIYVDANIVPNCQTIELEAKKHLEKHDIALHKHFKRDCIYDEINVIASGSERPINNRLDALNAAHLYKSIGHREHDGMYENSIIYRRHTELMKRACSLWHKLYESGAERDQLYLLYALDTYNIKIKTIDSGVDLRNNEKYRWSDHVHINYSDKNNIQLHPDHKSIDRLKKLEQIVQDKRFDYISFDIFDTLLFRSVLNPKDVFHLTFLELEESDLLPIHIIINHVENRIKAETSARNQIANLDPSFRQIYDEYQKLTQLSNEHTDRILEIEKQIELRICQPRINVINIMRKAHELGKKILITSDMYHDKEFILQILEKIGIHQDDYHKLYLSVAEDATKKHGTLFPKILSIENINPDNIIHIGDNNHSDIRMAAAAGIKSFRVFSHSQISNIDSGDIDSPNQIGNQYGKLNSQPFASRIHSGLVANTLYKDNISNIPNKISSNYEFGYSILGPFVFALSTWILEDLEHNNSSSMCWLARDGHLPFQATKIILNRSSYFKKIHHMYLPVSRKLLIPYFCQSLKGINYLNNIGFNKSLTSKNFVVKRFGIKALDLIEKKYNIQLDSTPYFCIKKRLDQLMLDSHQELSEIHNEQSELLIKYYQKNLGEKNRYSIFDVGRKGTFQKIFAEITNNSAVQGYYVATSSQIDSNTSNGGYKTFLGDYCASLAGPNRIDTVIYEALLSDPRPSFVGITNSLNFIREESDVSGDYYIAHSQIHAGALQYVVDTMNVSSARPSAFSNSNVSVNKAFTQWPEIESLKKILNKIPHEDSVSTDIPRSLGEVYIQSQDQGEDNCIKTYVPNPKTIFIFSPRMNTTRGGAEKVASLLALHFKKLNYKVILVSGYQKGGQQPVYDMPLDIPSVELNMQLENEIETFIYDFKPSTGIILASGPQPRLLCDICKRMGIKFINSERAEPNFSFQNYWEGNSKIDYIKYYMNSDKVVLQINNFSDFFDSDCDQDKIHIIPNPVQLPKYSANQYSNREKIILCVARIRLLQKRQDILIHAFSRVSKDIPEWKLYLVGKADEKDKQLIQDLVSNYNLEDRVLIFDHTEDIAEFYLKSSLFAFPSSYEGFPNALAEALSYGIPSIGSVKCPGVNHLIKNNFNGLLVNEESPENLIENLSNAILKAASSKNDLERMSLNAIESVKTYESQNVLKVWSDLVEAL